MPRILKALPSQLTSFRIFFLMAAWAVIAPHSLARAQTELTPPQPTAAVPTAPVRTAIVAAPQEPHYGTAGQWFLTAETFATALGNPGGSTGDVSLSWSSQDGSGTMFNLNLQPAIGYFVTDLVYGRLGFDFAFRNANSTDMVGVGVEPGIGVAVPLTRRMSFAPWVSLNLMYEHASRNSQKADYVKLDFEAHAPVVIDIIDHFSVTAGLHYTQGIVNHSSVGGSSQTLSKAGKVGLTAGLLGYW